MVILSEVFKPIDFARLGSLTLNDLYHPSLNAIIYHVTVFFTIANCFISPLTVYIILTKSTVHMGFYRQFLAIKVVIHFVFNLIVVIWNPVVFWPLMLGYSASTLEISSTMSYIILYIEMVLGFYLIALQVYVVIYRFIAMFLMVTNYHNKRVLYWPLVIGFVGSATASLGRIILVETLKVTKRLVPFIMGETDPETLRQLFEKNIPVVHDLFAMFGNVFGFYPMFLNGNITILLGGIASALVVLLLIFVKVCLSLTLRLQHLKTVCVPQAYILHRMLLK